MIDFRDLFQWDRFVTPSIIRLFYALAVIVLIAVGVAEIVSAVMSMVLQPLVSLIQIVSSLVGTLLGVIFFRIVSEFVLITFRINEHLGAIRNREIR
jgi:hypothetical protein